MLGIVFLVFGFGSPAMADLRTNGDFETGALSGWIPSGETSGTHVNAGTSGNVYHTGSNSLDSGSMGALGHGTRSLATTPGAEYCMTSWLQNPGGPTNAFGVGWGGAEFMSFTNSGGFLSTQYTVDDLIAKGYSTDLQFGIRKDPSWMNLDDVSVFQAVPEPSPLLIFGGSLVGLAVFGRRFKTVS